MKDNGLDDAIIIREIINGNKALYELLIRRNNPVLYKIGRTYNFSHEDTQDIMQDTFVNAYLHLKQFENRSSFKTWIIKIMLNNCYRKKQKFSFKNETAEDISDKAKPMFSDPQHTDTSILVINKELNCIMEHALQYIPIDYRLVFSLREMNHFSVKETSDILNITEANVKTRLTRAKSLMRKEIEKSYQPADIFEFNLLYCDGMVNRVMNRIEMIKDNP